MLCMFGYIYVLNIEDISKNHICLYENLSSLSLHIIAFSLFLHICLVFLSQLAPSISKNAADNT